MTKLYHRDIFMPEVVRHMTKMFPPVYLSEHARERIYQNNIRIEQSDIMTVHGSDIVEAEFDNGVLTKIVVRKQYSLVFDICYVLRYDLNTSQIVLVTVWLNDSHDNHSTLDESVYEKE